jgi:tripartite-type tricarboxylate transporter receptor subunit TctC
MKANRFVLLLLSGLSITLFFLQLPVRAAEVDNYPQKPIEIIVGYTAGGSEDLRYRALAPKMSEELGQPVVVVNKPGGSARIALTAISHAKPDGYTIGPGSASGFLFAPHMFKVEYDPLANFTFIAAVAKNAYGIVVKADSPWKTMQELVNYVRNHPGEIKYGAMAAGSAPHLYMTTIEKTLGLRWDHVPFKGDSETLTALLGGHIPVCISSTTFSSQVSSGKMRVLAIVSDNRLKAFPEVPVLREIGINIQGIWGYNGMIGPKGIPTLIVQKLRKAVKRGVEGDEFKKLMDVLSMEASYIDGDTYEKMVREVYPRIGDMVKNAGLSIKK